jgi:hypothetical protein
MTMLAGFELLVPKDPRKGLWLVPSCWDPKLRAETTYSKPISLTLEELAAAIQAELRDYAARTPPSPFIPEKEIRAVSRGCAIVIGRQTSEGQVKFTRMKRSGGWWTEDGKFEKPLIPPDDPEAMVNAVLKLARDP